MPGITNDQIVNRIREWPQWKYADNENAVTKYWPDDEHKPTKDNTASNNIIQIIT